MTFTINGNKFKINNAFSLVSKTRNKENQYKLLTTFETERKLSQYEMEKIEEYIDQVINKKEI